MNKVALAASVSGLFLAMGLVQSALAESDVEIPLVERECESSDSCFVPSILSVKKGETVVWKNNDITIHSLAGGSKDSGKSGSIQSGTIFPGKTFSYTVSVSGVFPYYCEIHPWMKGVIWAT